MLAPSTCRRFAVVGATGAMGRIVVRDLLWSNPQNVVLLLGRDRKKLVALRRTYGGKRMMLAVTSVHDVKALSDALRGWPVVVNAVQYELNLSVMRACLRAGSHYLDLGGLFHMTRKQLRLHEKFMKRGLLAVLGIGAAPGTTNLLATMAAAHLDHVSEIHIRVGLYDGSTYTTASPLSTSYSPQTVFEEFSKKPVVFTKGRWIFVPPMSGFEHHDFPKPVGTQRPMYTLHSEVATLPVSFRGKGVQEVSFKIAFDPDFVQKMRLFKKTMSRGRLLAMLKSVPPPVRKGPPKEHEVLRAIVRGTRRGKEQTIIADCHVVGMPAWGMGVDIDTGVPPSIVAQMIATGMIAARGCLPPEQCVPVGPFFRELRRRGMKVVSRAI